MESYELTRDMNIARINIFEIWGRIIGPQLVPTPKTQTMTAMTAISMAGDRQAT